MQRLIFRFAFALLACLIAQHAVYSCTLAVPPIRGFDKSEYVFTGTVIGLAKPANFPKDDANAWGVVVAVEENVHLPKASHRFAVFPYHLSPDCSTFGWDEEQVKEAYPIGTQVRVIAKEAKLIRDAPRSSASDADIIQLVIKPTEGIIAPNLPVEGYMASATSVYDYKSWRCPSPDEGALADSTFSIDEFELRKDLLRLRNAESQTEKDAILERLAYFPGVYTVDYASIVKSHVKNPRQRQALEQQRAAWEVEFQRDRICR